MIATETRYEYRILNTYRDTGETRQAGVFSDYGKARAAFDRLKSRKPGVRMRVSELQRVPLTWETIETTDTEEEIDYAEPSYEELEAMGFDLENA